VYEGNVRDIAFTMSTDAGATFTPPVRVSDDGWQIAGCPDDGPAMAGGSDGIVHVVWPTLVTGPSGPAIGLFHASTSDGRRFTARQQVPTEGQAHHPQLEVDGRGALALVWDELVSGSRRIVLARGTPDATGGWQFRREVVTTGESAIYPVVVQSSRHLLIAWTEGAPQAATVRVRRLAL
jgi:hypothetical protein